ncbi:MAG TPA: hypothetical protein DEH02_04245 [Bacteroidales bacterium]|nr:MAG: hypothetical protein A2X01_20485 [Bacteroidetes bacterium GWF2_35_48]OFY93678.1 MAG: hypothetical protein A2491_00930 [Bacteroidetes bacterium RIFOXYC12_FULL_35_7]HBX50265.1 hypothetical protein [Bacteroidales bacterium]
MAIFLKNGPIIKKNDSAKIHFEKLEFAGKIFDCNDIETADSTSDMEYQNIVESMKNILMFDPSYKNHRIFSYLIISAISETAPHVKNLPIAAKISVKKPETEIWTDIGEQEVCSVLIRPFSGNKKEILFGVILSNPV